MTTIGSQGALHTMRTSLSHAIALTTREAGCCWCRRQQALTRFLQFSVFFSRGRHHFVSVMFWWFKGGDVHRGNREPCTTNRLGLKLTHWLRWWPWKRPRFGLPSVVRLDLWPLVIWKQFSFGSKVRQFVGKHHMICSISVLLPFQVAAVCGSKFVSLKTPNGYFIKCPPQIHETVCLKGGYQRYTRRWHHYLRCSPQLVSLIHHFF
jgi:hypothetical protein